LKPGAPDGGTYAPEVDKCEWNGVVCVSVTSGSTEAEVDEECEERREVHFDFVLRREGRDAGPVVE
jgi:hypothetical protein